MDLNQIIAKKLAKQEITQPEINLLVEHIADFRMSDDQLSDFSKAVYQKGMNLEETTDLTGAMSQSGECFQWRFEGPVVDKHSTGGVGDLTSLILAPLLAACGCFVPMISGGSLGHTGGTIDKLQSIPGYCVQPEPRLFRKCVESVGVAIIAQSHWCAPADARLYAMRNHNNTINSVPLIVSSILSKKLAEGLDALVLDIKVGNGAWFASEKDAEPIKYALLHVSRQLGLNATCCFTDMHSPISYSVGNGLEVLEAIDFLTNKTRHPVLLALVRRLAVTALILSGVQTSVRSATALIDRALDSGAASERFACMIHFLQGPTDIIENPSRYLGSTCIVRPVLGKKSGRISRYDMKQLGNLCHRLSQAHTSQGINVNAMTGVSQLLPLDSWVEEGHPIAMLHAANERDWLSASQLFISSCIHISQSDGTTDAGKFNAVKQQVVT